MALTDFSAIYFCTDEDVLLEAQGDYDLLLPDGQKLAIGDDGSVLAGGWVLTSVSVNFTNQGVASGDVVFLEEGVTSGGVKKPFGSSGEPVVADSVSGLDLTLRRPGFASGAGQPLGGGGAITGIKFSIYTLRPQIKKSSDWVRHKLNWDEAADLIEDSESRHLTVLDTLYRLCFSAMRHPAIVSGQQAGGMTTDTWASKAREYKLERDELLEDLQSRRVSQDAVDTIEVVPRDH